MYFLEGFLVGLGMIVFIGPVFFLLLSTSLKFGQLPGFFVAMGIIVSDILCVLICYYGLSKFIIHPNSEFWISMAGGILLAGIGAKYIGTSKVYAEENSVLNKYSYLTFFSKGFLVNFVNPFVFMVWIGIIKFTEQTADRNENATIFLLGSLLGILTTDLLKVALAKHIKKFIKPQTLQWIYRIFGVILIGFGLRLFYHSIF
jgi:threonine/homoserine/homoserine lactone efflux protein